MQLRKLSNVGLSSDGWPKIYLEPAAFAVISDFYLFIYVFISTHQSALSPRGGLWSVLVMCIAMTKFDTYMQEHCISFL
jgi:hypothetical protein